LFIIEKSNAAASVAASSAKSESAQAANTDLTDLTDNSTCATSEITDTNQAIDINPAADTDQVTDTKLDLAEDTEMIDQVTNYKIIQRAPGKLKDGSPKTNTVYLQHVVHMPKMAEPVVPTIPLLPDAEMSQNIVSADNASAAEQDETYQDNTEDQSDTTVSDVVYQENDIPNDLLLINENQGLDTVAEDVYNSFPIKNRGGKYNVGFSRKSDQGLLSFSFKDSSILLNPIESNSVTADVYSNKVTYNNIYPDTDLSYTLEKDQLKEALTVYKYTVAADNI
jgi:hypothetical protein